MRGLGKYRQPRPGDSNTPKPFGCLHHGISLIPTLEQSRGLSGLGTFFW